MDSKSQDQVEKIIPSPIDNSQLRLIKIRHYRCGDYAGDTLALAPLAWDVDKVQAAINKAEEAYLKALDLAKNKEPAPDNLPLHNFYEKYPDKTVREIKALYEKQQIVYNEWQKRRYETKLQFSDFLKREGFVSFYADEAHIPEFEVSWGHRHGTPIDYSENKLDSFPPPIKIVDKEFEDDAAW